MASGTMKRFIVHPLIFALYDVINGVAVKPALHNPLSRR